MQKILARLIALRILARAWLIAAKLTFFGFLSKIRAYQLRRAIRVIERNGFAMVKFEERAGTLYITNQKDGSLWRLKAVK